MASTPATGPYSKPSESQTPQESAPVKQKASQDADPGDPQLGTAQAWKSKFDEEPIELFEPEDYVPEGSSKASEK